MIEYGQYFDMAEYRLYLELLFVGFVLLSILFINNIFLYKQKITDYISLMLIFGIAMSAFEIIWTILDAFPNGCNLRLGVQLQSRVCALCAFLKPLSYRPFGLKAEENPYYYFLCAAFYSVFAGLSDNMVD